MSLFESLFFRQECYFVVFELLLTGFSLSDVFCFELLDLFFPTGTFLCLCDLLLLFGDNRISVTEESFNFLFICILNRSLQVRIFFIFAVQVEDNFCQLRYLLRHLMMRFFTHLHCILFIRFRIYCLSICRLIFLDW